MCRPCYIDEFQALRLKILLNGRTLEDTEKSDMMWLVREIITHLSRATTIGRGTAIMPSTLFGVGYLGNGVLTGNW
jgi:2-keto-4-pentenoate hydratase/2-oxohepta-3-ene-1,7-dioic acid hydratase in catechol pathway